MAGYANRRGRVVLLGALLLLGLAAWLVLGDDGSDASAPIANAEEPTQVDPQDLLAADATTATTAAPTPVLAGRPTTDKARAGPVQVRVLGSRERPLSGMVVQIVKAEDAGTPFADVLQKQSTDADGFATFPTLPYDASRCARVMWLQPKEAGWIFLLVENDLRLIKDDTPMPKDSQAVVGPTLTLRIETGIPLHVDVVSADGGQRMPSVRWGVAPAFLAVPVHEQIGKMDYVVPLAHGASATLKFKVSDVPSDHLNLEKLDFRTRVHPQAERLIATLPLRPKARVLVLFDRPADVDAAVRWKARCGHTKHSRLSVMAQEDALGRWRLRNIAHIPGQMLFVSGTFGDYAVSGHGRLPMDPDETLVIEAKLRKVHRVTSSVTLRPRVVSANPVNGGGAGSSFTFKVAPRALDFRKGEKKKPEPRTLAVAARNPDGSPAPGAEVRLGNVGVVADEDGVARFLDPKPGLTTITVWGAGAVAHQPLQVPETGSLSATIRGATGGVVVVEVVDEDGNPMPFATLKVEPRTLGTWHDLVDGVQRLDPFTGANGRRTLHNLEAARTRITATLGSRSASVDVHPSPHDLRSARIVLAHPVPPKVGQRK